MERQIRITPWIYLVEKKQSIIFVMQFLSDRFQEMLSAYLNRPA